VLNRYGAVGLIARVAARAIPRHLVSRNEAGPNDGAEQTIAMCRRSTIRPCTSR